MEDFRSVASNLICVIIFALAISKTTMLPLSKNGSMMDHVGGIQNQNACDSVMDYSQKGAQSNHHKVGRNQIRTPRDAETTASENHSAICSGKQTETLLQKLSSTARLQSRMMKWPRNIVASSAQTESPHLCGTEDDDVYHEGAQRCIGIGNHSATAGSAAAG